MVWDGVLGLTALAAAVFGGAMFAFSAFVMPALRDLSPRDGVVAMQAVNVRAARSLLLLPLGALALGSAATAFLSVLGDPPDRTLRLVGAGLGLASFVVTAAANVPWNDRLASVDAGAPEAAGEWAAYLSAWTRWNHVRVVTSLLGAVLLGLAAPGA